jgi:hypothetical protein
MSRLDRRDLLKVGALGMGLGLADLLKLQARGEAGSGQRSVIILYMRGGPSQLDTWDMKPEAPSEIRGEFRPIATAVPGIHLCELLPLSARVMRHWSIVRSLHHRPEDGPPDHSRGDQIVFTGYPSGPNENENAHPSVGSVVSRQLQTQNPRLPAYVMIPRMIPGTDAAYLGQSCRPFETQADPANVGPFQVPNLEPLRGLTAEMIADRRGMLSRFDALRGNADRSGMMETMDQYQRQAWEILTSQQARRAFDLDAEPQQVRDRYGYSKPFMSRVRAGGDAPGWNQRVLLARRLVEAGVRLVTVDLRWWDTHEDNFWSLENGFLPRFDQCYSALIEDLQQRGLLESTLVVAWGEHGRTPRINNAAGRDHWGNCFSAAIAGGGVQGGRIVGESDQHAGQPKTNAKIPHDVLATIYRHLGIDTSTQFLDHSGRPITILPCGRPIDELF